MSSFPSTEHQKCLGNVCCVATNQLCDETIRGLRKPHVSVNLVRNVSSQRKKYLIYNKNLWRMESRQLDQANGGELDGRQRK